MVCSKWADSAPSAVTTLHPSSSWTGPRPPGVDHRLDGEDHARLEGGPGGAGPVVGDLGLLVHGRADGVAHVLPDHREPGRLGHLLDGPAHLVEAVARPELLDAGGTGSASVTSISAGGLGRDLPHPHGVGGVAVVALDDGPAVHRDDVPLLQDHRLRGDAVDDHRVGGGAHHGGKAVVVEEIGGRAPPFEHLAGHPVDVGGRDPGADGRPGGLVDLGHHPSGPAHLGQLARRCASSGLIRFCRCCSITLTIRRVTASGDPVPGHLTSCPGPGTTR